MMVLAGWLNEPIAGLSPAVEFTVTPVTIPTCLMYLLVKIPVDAWEEVSVTTPVVEAIFITLKPFSDLTAPLNVVFAISAFLLTKVALESP